MKNRNSELLAWICAIVVLVIASPALLRAVPPEVPATAEASTDEPLRLWHTIIDAPPEVEAMASTLGFKRFAWVNPKWYVSGNPRRFDRQKVDRNLNTIRTIVGGAD